MTTIDYLQREIRRTELSIRRAERKPNTPPEELRGLHEKLEHLQEALEAVNEHWQRVHDERGWMPRIDRAGWASCGECKGGEVKIHIPEFHALAACNQHMDHEAFDITLRSKFCPWCGRPLTDEAWAELERRVFGG